MFGKQKAQTSENGLQWYQARNVLITVDNHVKTSDFGVSEVINSYKGKPYVFGNFPDTNCYFVTCQKL